MLRLRVPLCAPGAELPCPGLTMGGSAGAICVIYLTKADKCAWVGAMTEIEGVQPGEFIKIKSDRPLASFVAVTSEVAQRWLQHNTHNRPTSDTGVLKYQMDMEAGRFAMTGEPIQFSKTGVLLNGQNRLTALANCVPSITLTLLVVRGLDDEVQRLMDQGIKRTPGQQLALMGIRNSNQVASAARLFMNWQGGMLFTDDKRQRALSLAAVEDWVTENQKLVDLFNRYLAQTTRSVGATPSVAGAFAMQALLVDTQAAISFFHLLHSRSNLPKGSPLLALDNRLRRVRAERMKISQRDELGYFIQCWNNWMRGDLISKVQSGKGGWNAGNFPRMETERGRKFDHDQFITGLETAGYEV